MRDEYDIENLNPRKNPYSDIVKEQITINIDGENFALEFIKKLVLAWDPDFTKLTLTEKKELEDADVEIRNGETVSHEEINWD